MLPLVSLSGLGFVAPNPPRQTIQESVTTEALQYVGATNDEEALQWHASMLLNQLAGLAELDEQPRHFPWRCCCVLSAPLRQTTLAEMQSEWKFVTNFVDLLPPTHHLHTQLSITRHQVYRDLMTKAERLHRNCIS